MPLLHIGKHQHLWALALAFLISGCATKTLEWQRHTEDEFPTRVNWIISQVGNVLDAKRGLRYGVWTVTSGEGGPLATYQCPEQGICEIKISNLQCKQSTGGPASCEFILYKNAICELVIPDKKETLEVGCPIEVALKPKGKGETVSPEATAAAAAAAAATAKAAQQAAGVAPAAPAAPAAAAAPKAAEEAAGVRPPAPKPTEKAPAPPPAAPAPPPATPREAPEPAPITPATESTGAVSLAAPAAASEQAKGQSIAGDFVFGLRAGLVVPTQQILENVSSGTSVGPLVNLEGYYVLTEWVRLGMMFEWHQFDIKSSGDAQLGTLSTYSFLPTVEFRPTREMMRGLGFEWVIPYTSFGIGVNAHSFSNATRLGDQSVSFPSTFAFRVAGGLDFPITSYLAVNGEVAWKRDGGTFTVGGVDRDFNASPVMFLLGLRFHF